MAWDLAAVLLVLGLLAATLWALRRAGGVGWRAAGRARCRGRLEVVERVPLGPQHALHLVRLGGRGLLVASHPAGCTLIESAPWPECVPVPPREEPS